MSEPIAAIATGAVRSAIGILRLSGEGCIQALSALFQPDDGRRLEDHPPRRLILGRLRDGEGRVLDHCLATLSRAPHSYTGEDTAELQCHGSPAVLHAALDALSGLGVRQARPGEFTRRAFLNGRMDLTQAEAVIDLIDAQTAAAARSAAGQLAGAISRRIDGVYQPLVDLLAHFHAVLDYPDEDIDPFEAREIARTVAAAEGQLAALLSTVRRGRQLTRGVACAIVGRPNAGKSSLLNALVGYDRAIVPDIPGTTRDTVEESVTLGGTLLRLIDTAGLRDSGDPVERLGVERSRAAMEAAELILVLVDGSAPFEEEDAGLLARAMELAPTILVITKADLPSGPVPFLNLPQLPPQVSLSARTGAGLDELEQAVAALFPPEAGLEDGAMLTNARQTEAAERAARALASARAGLESGMTPDAVLTDVEEALSALGEITGKTVREDVTARIFERFCVGK